MSRPGPALVLACLLAACHTPLVKTSDPAQLGGELAFLRDGVSTREEILVHLGEPAAAFEGERVLSYQLERDAAGGYRTRLPMTGKLVRWNVSLVLVFREDGVLEEHALVVAE